MPQYVDQDCGDCKDARYVLYILPINKNIWIIENLSLLLNGIKVLGYTHLQSKIVAENILASPRNFKLLTADKETAFKVLDILLSNKIDCKIAKVETGLIK